MVLPFMANRAERPVVQIGASVPVYLAPDGLVTAIPADGAREIGRLAHQSDVHDGWWDVTVATQLVTVAP